ncbi:HET-domain-containing protein [Hyaloscypha hepaticicola]|uniref:HET-domain-containing protein n=1 Tax=Hyaloscypha hepaticicola TaxID=2082293 RepID=A0A2J6QGM0_9HELO|nr:HET-domain-containing protein [Hyaloscypha hepaticicola]
MKLLCWTVDRKFRAKISQPRSSKIKDPQVGDCAIPHTYQYEELPPKGRPIRLLKLLPGMSDDKICLELFTTKLARALSYEAISYCWGDPNNLKEIICCGHTMEITYSLYSGLKRFRYPEKDRILWADAMCINQSDNKEKRIQVNMMGDIYDRATAVLVWLGEVPDLEAEKAFRLLRAINDYIDSQITDNELAANTARAVTDIPALVHRDQLFHDPSESEALRRFWLEPWFRRVWVLQEVALASTALVFYGESFINLSEVIQAAFIMSFRNDLENGCDVYQWGSAFIDSLSTYTTKDTWIQESRLLRGLQERLKRQFKPTFKDILFSSYRFEATNPLDHIYAFLGHPTAKTPGGGCLLEADYTISIEDACLKLTESLYKQNERLDFLCLLSHSTLADIEEYPSWIPMIHKTRNCNSLDHSSWNADHSAIKDFPKVVLQDRMLHGNAFIFDSIKIFSDIFGWDIFESTNSTAVEKCWNMQPTSIQPSESEGRLYAFMLTLVAGIYLGDKAQLQRDFNAFCQEKTSPEFCSSIGVKNVETEHTSLGEGNWREFEKMAYSKMRGRRFFISESGRIGLGPTLLQEGDLCCVLIGCRMPLVIRPTSTSNHFKVLGEAYIDDVIFGGVIDAHIGDALELPEITLV